MTIAFFTVQTAVGLIGLVRQKEDMGQLLFRGSDTAGIFAAQDIGDSLG